MNLKRQRAVDILTRLEAGALDVGTASKILGVGARQVHQLRARFQEEPDPAGHVGGVNLYMNFGCVVLDCNLVQLGGNLLCGPYVQIYTAYHPTDPRMRLARLEQAVPIKIGDSVWIGGGAIIGAGVTIGDNSVIGAGSIVLKDIPPGVLATGNPCRVILPL